MIFNLKFKKGFTIIELLVTISLGAILVLLAIPIYGNLQVSVQLDEQSALVVQTLRTAKERSVAGYNDSAHGVFFSIDPGGTDSYILYQGSSYATRDVAYDQGAIMESALSFQNSDFILTGDDLDINFSQTSGAPNNTGMFSINHSVSGQKNVTVNSLGAVAEN